MTTHEIKLQEQFCNPVFCGQKTFEIRLNDRGYQRDDTVRFIPVDEYGVKLVHPIQDATYRIGFVVSGWGLKDGYVAFSIRRV